jgi:iron complex transport system substrate-binding protein
MLRRTLLAALAAVTLSSTSMAAPLEVTDALGRTVTINTPVNRVIVNFNFEEFTAVAGVDGWKKVVGISRAPWEGWRPVIFNRYKAVIPNLADMPDIGNADDNNFSVEKVISLKPDVLLLADWTFKSLKTGKDQIEAAGIPIVVIDYNAQDLARHLASTRALGKVMGQDARADEIARYYEAKYSDVMARVAKANPATKPKVYFELGQAGAETIGNTYAGTMWGKIADLMGAENIANGKLPGPWGPLNAEAVIAANPDAIFIAGSSWVNRPKAVKTGYQASETDTSTSLAPYAARPGWADLKAVKAGNFNAIEHGLCRTLFDFVAMQVIGKQLYPEQFKDVDPAAEFKAYHEKYLPVSFAGNWWVTLKP